MSLTGCELLTQLQTAQQAQSGTASVIQGDNSLPGAQKGGVVVDNKPYQAQHQPNGVRYKDHIFYWRKRQADQGA